MEITSLRQTILEITELIDLDPIIERLMLRLSGVVERLSDVDGDQMEPWEIDALFVVVITMIQTIFKEIRIDHFEHADNVIDLLEELIDELPTTE